MALIKNFLSMPFLYNQKKKVLIFEYLNLDILKNYINILKIQLNNSNHRRIEFTEKSSQFHLLH